ncbi:response regulator [Bradyrhizobium sp. SYSU BS000235]|uniref:response regulator n=1 Tax=Bradyrhizobium sp. SYSU BS000235 TaxID=3411332 RepID=UPI003C71D585
MKHPILIVEDEYFIADDCARFVEKAGYRVVGPFHNVDEAKANLPDFLSGAVLDVNVDGILVYQLLDELLKRNVPVAIYTGYDGNVIPARYSHLSIVTKPRECRDVVELLCRQIERTAIGETSRSL